jgi:aromatic-L-amino-acid decarboxylase
MFTNFDCDCFYIADRQTLTRTLGILPDYLQNQASESGAVIDYRDWHIPLGRRFRALKLWFVIRHYGIEGLQFHVRRHIQLAHEFASWIENDDRFELVVPPPLNLICFRHVAGEDFNRILLDRLNRSGQLYLTHTRLYDRFTLRFCVGQTYTQRKHVKRAWEQIRREATVLETE